MFDEGGPVWMAFLAVSVDYTMHTRGSWTWIVVRDDTSWCLALLAAPYHALVDPMWAPVAASVSVLNESMGTAIGSSVLGAPACTALWISISGMTWRRLFVLRALDGL